MHIRLLGVALGEKAAEEADELASLLGNKEVSRKWTKKRRGGICRIGLPPHQASTTAATLA
jgi:hypothetical protein